MKCIPKSMDRRLHVHLTTGSITQGLI